MEDPFARLTGDAAKSLKAGYKAMQAKKYDEARTAFAAVVSAAPDYSPARMQEIKAAVLGGHTADVPALWKDLLGRDFVAYAGRLDKPREFGPPSRRPGVGANQGARNKRPVPLRDRPRQGSLLPRPQPRPRGQQGGQRHGQARADTRS